MSPTPAPERPRTIADVARLAGVSVGTVSNVLNNPQRVSAARRRRVEEVLLATGFVRNAAARRLNGAPSTTVGCLLIDLSNPFFAEVARGVEDALAEQDCLITVRSTDVDVRRQERYLHLLLESQVRAVILSPVTADTDLRALTGRGVPVVLLDDTARRPDACSIATDGVMGGRLAAGHLLDLGHRRIALLRHPGTVPSLNDRLLGARLAVGERGLDPDEVFTEVALDPPDHDGDPGAAIDRALAGERPCTAFLCYNDMAALSTLTGLRDRGLSVPTDVSVIGYDDLVFADRLSPALTTVRQPTYELGRGAARLALAEGDPGHRHEHVRLTPSLVVRASTAPAAPAAAGGVGGVGGRPRGPARTRV